MSTILGFRFSKSIEEVNAVHQQFRINAYAHDMAAPIKLVFQKLPASKWTSTLVNNQLTPEIVKLEYDGGFSMGF